MSVGIVALMMLAVAIGYVVLPAVLLEIQSARAPHEVVCPTTRASALVQLDAKRSVRALFVESTQPLVVGCSRWPAAAGCNRACERAFAPRQARTST